MYLDELADWLVMGELKILIRCGQTDALEIRSAAVCYDFAFETISWTLREEASPLMGLSGSGGCPTGVPISSRR